MNIGEINLGVSYKICSYWWEARPFCCCNYWESTSWPGVGLYRLSTAQGCWLQGKEETLSSHPACQTGGPWGASTHRKGHLCLSGRRYLLLGPSHLLTKLWAWAATWPRGTHLLVCRHAPNGLVLTHRLGPRKSGNGLQPLTLDTWGSAPSSTALLT